VARTLRGGCAGAHVKKDVAALHKKRSERRLGLRENLYGTQEPTQGRKLGPATGEQEVQDAFK
jgi:hypothetical protein